MNDPKHPIWALVRQLPILLILTVVLYFTAHKFDADELITIITVLIAGGSSETIANLLNRKTN